MAKQVTESHFRKAILAIPNTYIDKIQVNPNAHTTTIADYMIQTKHNDIMVECKEVRIKNRKTKPVFYIERLTQQFKMTEWEQRVNRNLSMIFLCFWNGNKKTSHAYFIPLKHWNKILFKKKCISIEDCDTLFLVYKINNNWDLKYLL